MNAFIQSNKTASLTVIALSLACFGLMPLAQAVNPPPDGGYPGFNTAEGQNALSGLTTGTGNTAVGWFSLFSNTEGSFNTALGAGTLLFNVGDQITGKGMENTAIGTAALLNNTTGYHNTASGSSALVANNTGVENTATGYQALSSNTIGGDNTANGLQALLANTGGSLNTAIGVLALSTNTTGSSNTAIGAEAGTSITTASNVIAIGAAGSNVSNSCFIGNIFGTIVGGTAVFVDGTGQLGTNTSSRRFKEEIRPMERASESLFALTPVSFRYKKDIDPAGTQQLGLVAEDVEKVNPNLIVRDREGRPYSVRYDQVNAMLLNEFLKEHAKVEQLKKDLESKIVEQQKQIEALTAGLQKVSAQLELSNSLQDESAVVDLHRKRF
jgi:hypothetical protein